MRPGQRPARVDGGRLAGERGRGEEGGGVVGEVIEIGDDPVAHQEGALGRLDQPVDMGEAFRLGDAELVEDRQDQQRRQPLRGRRRGPQFHIGELHAQRRAGGGAIGLEIGAGDRAAGALEVGGDLAADIAAVIIVEPGAGELFQRVGEALTAQHRAGGGDLAVRLQEGGGEARHVLQLGELLGGEAVLRAGDGDAGAGMADGGLQQPAQRQAPAEGFRRLQRQHPAADLAGHGERGERAARRDHVMAAVAIEGMVALAPA